MEEHNIIEMLSLVGEELHEMGVKKPIRIILVGGAYMVTQIHNRSMTRDVDIIVQLERDTEEYRKLKNAAKFIAQDLNASPAWLSDNMADFFQSLGKAPRSKLWFSNGSLEVYLPEPDYIFVLKVLSGRDKDLEDIEALLQLLNLKNRKQAEKLIQKYTNQATQAEHSHEIQVALDSFF
jgi:hypothetical protein